MKPQRNAQPQISFFEIVFWGKSFIVRRFLSLLEIEVLHPKNKIPPQNDWQRTIQKMTVGSPAKNPCSWHHQKPNGKTQALQPPQRQDLGGRPIGAEVLHANKLLKKGSASHPPAASWAPGG